MPSPPTSDMRYVFLRVVFGRLRLEVGAPFAWLFAIVILALTGHLFLAVPSSFLGIWQWLSASLHRH